MRSVAKSRSASATSSRSSSRSGPDASRGDASSRRCNASAARPPATRYARGASQTYPRWRRRDHPDERTPRVATRRRHERVRGYLRDLSRSRAQAGFSPAETATFVLSLKEPLFDRAASVAGGDATRLQTLAWDLTLLIDSLAVFSADEYLRTREEIIARQGQELLELSTPVVKLWEGVVAVPLIGTLDSARTQVVMESLLERIVATGSSLAIIDITGVPTVDTLVAQHLLKTVAAARLMGADCIISGIRPQIAQTMVHLQIDLSTVTPQATMAEALRTALQRIGYRITKAEV